MMTVRVMRGIHLLELGRTADAEREFRAALTEQPNNAYAHALLSRCLVERKEFDEATREAEAAVGLGPDDPRSHFALARVWHERNYDDRALHSIGEAIRLQPQEAEYFAFRAMLHLGASRWSEALADAETGLRSDPEHINCNNLRAMALVKLGRRNEAGNTIDAALARDPQDAFSHANKGWALLEARDPKRAMNHFREALRLQPTMEYARAGIVEALKARNPIYALFLRYMFWMSRFSPRVQFAIILGGYFGQRFLRDLEHAFPSLAWLTAPLIIAYVVFAIFSWLARPIFNLLLRLHPFGKLALSTDETREANWIGGYLLTAVCCLAASFGSESLELLFFPAVCIGLSTMPLCLVFRSSEGWPKITMIGVMAALGILTVLWPVAIAAGEPDITRQVQSAFLMTFIASITAGQWIAGQTPRR